MISQKTIKKISLTVLVSVVVIIFFVLNFNFYFSDLLISKLTYQNSIASPHSSLVSKVNNLESDSKIYESITNENKELRKLLQLQNESQFSLVNGEIVIQSPIVFSATAYVNRGKRDGVRENLIVISGGGLVGKIGDVYRDYSEILFPHNPKFNLLVFIGDKTASGILKGDGVTSYVKYISDESKVNIGDSVYLASNTSADYLNFKIGKVSEIKTRSGFLQVKVRNSLDPKTAKFVSIIKNEKN